MRRLQRRLARAAAAALPILMSLALAACGGTAAVGARAGGSATPGSAGPAATAPGSASSAGASGAPSGGAGTPSAAPGTSAGAPSAFPGASAGTASSPAAASGSPALGTLTVFAAASLSGVFRTLAPLYAETHPGGHLTFSFDASSALRVQIEQGAPADVFASADVSNAQALAAEGLAAAAPTVFVRNTLALVVPRGDPAKVASPLDLARPGLSVVMAGPEVPITLYTNEVLDRLARLPGYPADFVARVQANVVSREEDVSAVLTKVALGEADAGIVYKTDAASTNGVQVVPIPPSVEASASYAAVAVAGSRHAVQAAAFVAWLTSPAAQQVFARFGFLPPG